MLLEDPFDSLDRSHEHLRKFRVGCLSPQQEKTAAVLHDRPLRQGVVPDISVVRKRNPSPSGHLDQPLGVWKDGAGEGVEVGLNAQVV